MRKSTSILPGVKRSKGFTIVELLIVIVVIAILAAITIVAYNGLQLRANITTINSDLTQINKTIKAYHAVNGTYPIHSSWVSQSTATKNTFITGLVPDFVNALPQPIQIEGNPRLYYRTDVTGANYKLVYLYPSTESIPGSVASDPNVASLIDPSRPTRGWGYWTSGGSSL